MRIVIGLLVAVGLVGCIGSSTPRNPMDCSCAQVTSDSNCAVDSSEAIVPTSSFTPLTSDSYMLPPVKGSR